MWLSVAAFEDLADFIIQENNYISFISNTGKTVGKGPTLFSKRMKECRAQRKFVESACNAIQTTDLHGEVEKHTDLDSLFIPSNAAKHRVPKKFSMKNPVQKFKQRTAKEVQPEPVRCKENDEDADNEEDGTSDSDKDEYWPPIHVETDDDDDDSDVNQPDDCVTLHPEPMIPIC